MRRLPHRFPERRLDTLTRANVAPAEVGPDPAAVVRHVTGHTPDAYEPAKWQKLLARAGRLAGGRAQAKGA